MLAAAMEELAAQGVEGFTLRGCARRAGVSHAAPAHHFGDATGLLTALAIEAFGRLSTCMADQAGNDAPGSIERLVGTGLGYATFASENPDLFKLMFRTGRLHRNNEPLITAGRAAFAQLVDAVAAYYGAGNIMANPTLARRVMGLWSLVHGFAELALNEQFGTAAELREQAEAFLAPTIREMFAGQSDARDATDTFGAVRLKPGSDWLQPPG